MLNAITFCLTPDAEADHVTKTTLRPVEEREPLINDHKADMRKKVVDGRISIYLDNKNQENLPKYKKDPSLLVKCTIRHKLKETKDDNETWQKGVVEFVEKTHEDPLKTTFGVRYPEDDDVDKIYFFPLLKDMQNKDCFVIKSP